MAWYLQIWKQLGDYKTRSPRKVFWMFFLINFLLFLAIGIIGIVIATLSDDAGFWFPLALSLILICLSTPASLALTVRRLHDSGKSGWFILLYFVPVVGGLIMIILLCLESEYGENKWGPNPYGIGNQYDVEFPRP
jgi:uncharacterized membrane protein YhaH (DUF805 family)